MHVVPPVPSPAIVGVSGTGRNAGGSTSATSTFIPSASPVAPLTGSGPVHMKLRVPTKLVVKRAKVIAGEPFQD